MTVHFIGAGPGAPDLITLRGRNLIERCPVCLYAGSIVPRELLAYCPDGARVVDTAPLVLDEIEAEFVAAHAAGLDVARLQSGDLSVFSALAEQIRRLEGHGIPYTLTPGVPAFAAAAAALGRELTVPEVAQSVVLTRVSGRASQMPDSERLAAFAATGATLAIHLAIHALDKIAAELIPFYGADCPVAVVAEASRPGERIVRGTLGDIAATLAAHPIERTAMILVGRLWRPRTSATARFTTPIIAAASGEVPHELARTAHGRPACRRGRTRQSRPERLCRRRRRKRFPAPRAPLHRQGQRPPLWRGSKASAAVLEARMRSASAGEPPALSASLASMARSTEPRREWRSSRPWASLVILPTPPAMVTRGTGWVAHISACRRRNRPCRSAPSRAARASPSPPPRKRRPSRRRYG